MKDIIRLNRYSFAYEGAKDLVLKEIDLSIGKGEIVIIAGASGSGKSTLLRSLNGLIPHVYRGKYVGEVWVDGLLVKETPTHVLATRVGFVFQNPENQIFMFTVERDVAFGLENLGYPTEEIRKRVDWALDLLGLSELRKRAPHELSDGQKQRVAIAGALVLEPKILILDEPTSLLDPETAYGVVNLVRELNRKLGLTVILVEHRLELVTPIADRLVVMNEGMIVGNGKPVEVLENLDLYKVGLSPPTIINLQLRLRRRGMKLNSLALDVNEFIEKLGEPR
jgi:energy-coupling factor transporter ATP-binding protein EcfA2